MNLFFITCYAVNLSLNSYHAMNLLFNSYYFLFSRKRFLASRIPFEAVAEVSEVLTQTFLAGWNKKPVWMVA